MSHKSQPASAPKAQRDKSFDFGNFLAIGLSLGLVFGTLFGNIAMGLIAGLLLATLANAYHEKRQGKENATLSFAISTGALLFMILVWVLSAMGWL